VCRFSYEIIRKNSGELLAEGETTHVVVDAQSGRPKRMPDHYIEIFQEGMKP
jgi:acyl-CoA thioesterase FadM